jgi:hypothetical protein
MMGSGAKRAAIAGDSLGETALFRKCYAYVVVNVREVRIEFLGALKGSKSLVKKT